ncbi:hypothetical protein A0H81_10874 [Grifola frondosa]|uniref:Uncharacterized protein n=1 Tax=Grifola frondosa TaxID=5627 RepID=A0A1C7LWP1_GRIFR|nr:hypothetical protein A0H81_10874 [Grifola frondosa]
MRHAHLRSSIAPEPGPELRQETPPARRAHELMSVTVLCVFQAVPERHIAYPQSPAPTRSPSHAHLLGPGLLQPSVAVPRPTPRCRYSSLTQSLPEILRARPYHLPMSLGPVHWKYSDNNRIMRPLILAKNPPVRRAPRYPFRMNERE